MSTSVYQRVTDLDIDSLVPELRTYFTGSREIGVGTGVFEVAGSRLRILRPLLVQLARKGILFPDYARDVPFDIVNSPTADGALHAVRTFHLPEGDRVLIDTMRVINGRLHDFMGKREGFEVQLSVTIKDGILQMRSDRQWLNLARVRIRLPRLATVTVTESWDGGRQHVDVRLRSPVLGEWFRYAGSFDYQYRSH
jgi:hypothetical protein